jgi:hypothetical protein
MDRNGQDFGSTQQERNNHYENGKNGDGAQAPITSLALGMTAPLFCLNESNVLTLSAPHYSDML